jgi:adenosylcobinamide-GDP ribazoletransferase
MHGRKIAMSSLRDAASFLTRVPLHRDGATDMSRAVPWFGAVGAVIGLIQGAIYVGLLELTTPTLAAALATAVVALITGAFHHDGLADIADAFGGGWTREQRLEILKDSRLGTYGVTTLVFIIVIEVAALASLGGWVALGATVVAHALSRAASGVVMTLSQPAQDSGLGVDYLAGLNKGAVRTAAVLILGITVALFGVSAIAIAAATAISAVAVVRLSYAKIGGISGDVLGAVQQLTKVAIVTVVSCIALTVADPGSIWGLAFR